MPRQFKLPTIYSGASGNVVGFSIAHLAQRVKFRIVSWLESTESSDVWVRETWVSFESSQGKLRKLCKSNV